MQCLPLPRSPCFWVALALLATACSDASVTRTAGARRHRRDGGRGRSARRRRPDGAPLRQLPRRAGPGPATRPRSTHAAISSRTSRCTCSRASRVSNSRQPDEARVKLQVGMAGRGGATGQAGASPPTCTTSTWSLVREGGEWKVSYADWRRALTQVSTSVICDRSSGLYSTGRRRSAPCNAHPPRAAAPLSPAESTTLPLPGAV